MRRDSDAVVAQLFAPAVLGLLALLAACGGSSSTSPGSGSNHSYAIVLSLNATIKNTCTWAETDHASLNVTMTGFTGVVSDIEDNTAGITMTSCNSTCTETLISAGSGPITIGTVMGVGENPADRSVTIEHTGTVVNALFQDNCAGMITQIGGNSASLPGYISFLDNGMAQDNQVTDPATGQSVRIQVTPR